MSDTVNCPSCALPGHAGMYCSWCNAYLDETAVTTAAGTLKADEVIAYRAYRVDSAGKNGYTWVDPDLPPVLASPVYPMHWAPGIDWYEAECHGEGAATRTGQVGTHHGSHDDPTYWPPVKGCGGGGHGCGFYTSRTWAHALENGYHGYTAERPYVMARVQLAGKIIPATNGFRSQKIKILEVYVPHELWKLGAALKSTYPGVTITMRATMVMPSDESEGAILWCAKCKAKMPPRSRTCSFCKHAHN